MTRDERIIARIARKLAGDAVAGLEETLGGSELQSLMLHVYRRRSAARAPAELLRQYDRVRMLQPARVDPRRLLEVEAAAYRAAEGFEALELAPVAPLGINQVLGEIDQNSCLATVRQAEVLADPTTMAALECARRRRNDGAEVRLCSIGRQLRLQPYDHPEFLPHFKLFSMVTAGRDHGSHRFEMAALGEQLHVYLAMLEDLSASGYRIGEVVVSLSHTGRDAQLLERAAAEVLTDLGEDFPWATMRLDPDRERGRAYYSGLCLSLDADTPEGHRINLADGGFTDWTRRLLANAKERLLVSGLGIELLARLFR